MLTTDTVTKFVLECIADMTDVSATVDSVFADSDEDGLFFTVCAVIGISEATFRVWDEDGITAWEVDTEFNG